MAQYVQDFCRQRRLTRIFNVCVTGLCFRFLTPVPVHRTIKAILCKLLEIIFNLVFDIKKIFLNPNLMIHRLTERSGSRPSETYHYCS